MSWQTDDKWERIYGKWEPVHYADILIWRCSKCGELVDLEDGRAHDYCSSCGTRMEEIDPGSRNGGQKECRIPDIVTSPTHYIVNGLECFGVMKTVFGVEAVKIFAKLNAFKYLWRSDRKGGKEDLQKAIAAQKIKVTALE